MAGESHSFDVDLPPWRLRAHVLRNYLLRFRQPLQLYLRNNIRSLFGRPQGRFSALDVTFRGFRHDLTIATWGEWSTFNLIFLSDLYAPTAAHRKRIRDAFVLDVGAHVGYFSLYAAMMGARRVVAIEPVPAMAQRVRELVTAFGLEDKVHVVEASLGSQVGRSEIQVVDEAESSLSSSAFLPQSQSRQAISVEVVDVPTLLADFKELHVDYLKLNCEGGEFEIVDSLSAADLSNRCSAIVGWHAFPGLPEPRVLVEQLQRLGFAVSAIRDPGLRFLIADRVGLGNG